MVRPGLTRRLLATVVALHAGLWIALPGWRASDPQDEASRPTAREVFERRILPIFRSPDPSSCVQCHLAGVDLKDYILPSHEKTFVSLRDQGLVDLDKPEQSKILRFIDMKAGDNPGADLVYAKVRNQEREAFAEWIRLSCNDPALRSAPTLASAERARPALPREVIRHGRRDQLLESFTQNVWSMRFRCMGCHTQGNPENDKLVPKHGERVRWMKATAEETMAYLIAKPDMIDTAKPEFSMFLLKPLGDLDHGGGTKFLPGDLGYKGFRAWLEDYSAIVRKKYARASDLPRTAGRPLEFGTDIWLKLAGTPADWGDKLLRVDVHAWDAAKKAWEPDPIASSDRGVWAQGKLWQHNLTLFAAPGSARAEAWKRGKPALPEGRYLVKSYLDRNGRLAKDWKASLGKDAFSGQAEVSSKWPEGYGAMTVVDASKLRK